MSTRMRACSRACVHERVYGGGRIQSIFGDEGKGAEHSERKDLSFLSLWTAGKAGSPPRDDGIADFISVTNA